jgi:hypothetical protein
MPAIGKAAGTVETVTFDARDLAAIERRARDLHARAQAATSSPASRLTLDEWLTLTRHCEALQRLHRINVRPEDYVGQTAEQVAASVQAKAGRMARGNGRKALVRKYGEDLAGTIIGEAKAGRRGR